MGETLGVELFRWAHLAGLERGGTVIFEGEIEGGACLFTWLVTLKRSFLSSTESKD